MVLQQGLCLMAGLYRTSFRQKLKKLETNANDVHSTLIRVRCTINIQQTIQNEFIEASSQERVHVIITAKFKV